MLLMNYTSGSKSQMELCQKICNITFVKWCCKGGHVSCLSCLAEQSSRTSARAIQICKELTLLAKALSSMSCFGLTWLLSVRSPYEPAEISASHTCSLPGLELHLTDVCPSLTKFKEQSIKRLSCNSDDVTCIVQALSPVVLSLSAAAQP